MKLSRHVFLATLVSLTLLVNVTLWSKPHPIADINKRVAKLAGKTFHVDGCVRQEPDAQGRFLLKDLTGSILVVPLGTAPEVGKCVEVIGRLEADSRQGAVLIETKERK